MKNSSRTPPFPFQVYSELEAITDKLATESQRGSYKKPISNNISPPASPAHNGNGNANSPNNTVQSEYTVYAIAFGVVAGWMRGPAVATKD